MRYFVGQNRIQNSLARPLDIHFPAKHFTAIEHKTSRTTGSKIWLHLCIDRAWLRPCRQFFAEPFDCELLAIDFGLLADFFCELWRWRVNDEIRRLVTGTSVGDRDKR